jgi:hypothetical protein
MGAVWLRVRAQLRGRVRTTILLVLFAGLAGGIVLAAVAGARRTDVALPRFLAYHQMIDASVDFLQGHEASVDLARQRAKLAALPEVRQAVRATAIIVAGDDGTGALGRRRLAYLPLDPGGSAVFGRPIVVAGRLPADDQPDEVAIDEELAGRRHLWVGSHYRVGAYTTGQFGPAGEGAAIQPAGAVAELRVAGIVRQPDDLAPIIADQDNIYVDSTDLYLSPAYWRRYGPDLARYGIGIGVVLDHGRADVPRFRNDVSRLFPANSAGVDLGPFTLGAPAVPAVRRAIGVESGGLLAFAVLAGLATLLLVGQTLARQVFLESVEYPTLRALGMTRAQLVGVALIRATLMGAGSAVVAVAAAVALSPLTPIGVARRAELHPGISADLAVLTAGAVAVVALVNACALLPAWRASRAPGGLGGAELAGAERPSRLAGALASAGFRPPAVAGVRLALEPGRGLTAVPVRTAIAGVIVAVCALTAAAGFGASLARLTATPSRYGVTWDVSVGNFASPEGAMRGAQLLAANPDVAGYVGLNTGQLFLDGRPISTLALERGKGAVSLAVADGRTPARPDEIALGATTMTLLGKRLGDTVAAAIDPRSPRPFRVVGRLVLNSAGVDNSIAPGKGAVVIPEAFERLVVGNTEAGSQVFLVRLQPASDRARVIQRLGRDFPGTLVTPLTQPDIRNVQRVAYLPKLLAGLVALLALGTLTHTLVSCVRRRRRDLAILKTLGFVRAQVSATVAWQATTIAAVALLAGIPLGIAVGRWAWRVVAAQLGVVSGPVLPLLAVLAIAVGTVLAANLIAAAPGWAAGRTRPAVVFRSE